MTKRIIILCPTRGRNDNHERLARSFLATNPQRSLLVFGVDDDDASHYQTVADNRIEYYVLRERSLLVPKMNHMANHYAKDCAIIGLVGDDCLFLTPDWEQQVLEAFEDGAVMAWPDDGVRGIHHPLHWFVDSQVIRCLGYMAPPTLQHNFCDNFMGDLGRALGRARYLPLFYLEHRHPDYGLETTDESYRQNRSLLRSDGVFYSAYKAEHFERDMQRVRTLLEIEGEIPVVRFPHVFGRRLRVLVTTPFYHAEMTANYLYSLLAENDALLKAGIDLQLQPISNWSHGGPLTIQRNRMSHLFRKGDWQADVHVFVDSDNGYRGNDLLRMIACGLPIVGLNCPKRVLNLGGVTGEYASQKEFMNALLLPTIRTQKNGKTVHGMKQVYFVGAGVLVIWREVYGRIINAGVVEPIAFQEQPVETADCWRFWHEEVTKQGHPLGAGIENQEDWNFCDKARKSGIDIFCDPRAEASHAGLFTFAGQPRWPAETTDIDAEQTKECPR